MRRERQGLLGNCDSSVNRKARQRSGISWYSVGIGIVQDCLFGVVVVPSNSV